MIRRSHFVSPDRPQRLAILNDQSVRSKIHRQTR